MRLPADNFMADWAGKQTPYDNGSISILAYIFSGLRVRVVLQGADSSEEAGPLVPHLQEGE